MDTVCYRSIGMSGFEHSASNKSNHARFEFDAERLVRKVKGDLTFLDGKDARTVGWRPL